VLPLLPRDRHEAASGLLKAIRALLAEALGHGDPGPEPLPARDMPSPVSSTSVTRTSETTPSIWHGREVTHGLDTGDQDAVRSGLDGVLDRLPGIRSL
jgi:hypothetical protein